MNESPNWVFRVRVRTKTPIDRKDLPVTLSLPGFPPVEVRIEERPMKHCAADAEKHCPTPVQPPAEGERFTFIGRGFASEDAAHKAGEQFLDALLVAGALGAMGIDVGFSRATVQYSKEVHDGVRNATGRELRADLIGLMTYQDGTVRIVNTTAEGFTTVSADSLQSRLCQWIGVVGEMTERQRTCASLLNDSFYVAQVDAQFVLRISAVEALCDQRDVSTEYAQLIDNVLAHVETMTDADAAARKAVRQVLVNARRESVGQAYRRKFNTLLGNEAAEEFKGLYDLRSKFLHDGKWRGELQEPSNKVLDLARKLLEADLAAEQTRVID